MTRRQASPTAARPWPLLLTLAGALASASRAGAASPTELTWSPLVPRGYGAAVCNDNSTAGYYFRSGANASALWLVFLESGGWCYDADSCSRRSRSQTSSLAYSNTTDVGGLMNATDPRLAAANVAYVPYCTSDAYVGAAAGPAFTGAPGFPGGFAGAAVVRAVWADLLASRGLGGGGPRNVLFAGFSAGGRGVLFNCDAVRATLEAAVPDLTYGCLMDSAVWLDVPPYRNTSVSAAARSAAAYALFNASATVAANSPACFAALRDWRCIFGEYAAPFVGTRRLFYNSYLYDSYQLDTMGGIGSAPPWGDAGKLAYAEGFRGRMEATMARLVPASAADGGARGRVSAACFSHGNTLTPKFEWQRVGRTTLAAAVAAWAFGDDGAPRVAADATPGANTNPYCAADVPAFALALDAAAPPVAVVDDHFVGVNVDTGSLYHGLDWGDGALAALAAALAPGTLRVGGGAADALLFVPDGGYGAGPDAFASGLNAQVTYLNASAWRAVARFAAATGLSLLWGANGLSFRSNVTWGSWNRSGDVPWPQGKACPACARDPPFEPGNGNLTALLAQAAAEGLCVDALSVGNEPDLWYRYGVTMSGAALAADVRAWGAAAAAALPGVRLAGPSWAGFNATDAAAFFAGMRGAGPYMGTSHYYPIPNSQQGGGSSGCDVAHFIDAGRFADPGRSSLAASALAFTGALATSGAAEPPRPGHAGDAAAGRDVTSPRLVLEETATAALGGCANYSDRFVAGFFLLHALTEPFERGFQQVQLQDLVGWSFTGRPSQYALLGPPGWVRGSAALAGAVKPTYWATLLHRQAVGAAALRLAVSPGVDADPLFGAHAWCAGAGDGMPPGAVALVFTNGHATPVALDVDVVGGGTGGGGGVRRIEFVLTAPDGGTESTEAGLLGPGVLLNGAPLALGPDGALPPLPFVGRLVPDPVPVTVPALSYGWILLLDAGVGACDAAGAARAPLPGVRPCGAAGGSGGGPLPPAEVAGIVVAAAAAVVAGVGVWRRASRARRRSARDGADAPTAATRLLA